MTKLVLMPHVSQTRLQRDAERHRDVERRNGNACLEKLLCMFSSSNEIIQWMYF